MSDLQRRIEKFKEKLLEKKNQMESCIHLFVKQQEGYWVGGFHSSDYEYTPCVVTCLKCGLNNRHFLDRKYMDYLRTINISMYYLQKINDEVFKKQFYSSAKGETLYNLISSEVFKSTNPSFLFQIAKQVDPDADNKKLFAIMKELYELEKIEGNINKISESKVKSLIIGTGNSRANS